MKEYIVCTTLAALTSCSGSQPSPGSHSARGAHGVPGDRVAIHGMVLFGQTHVYLAHIPTFDKPHNEQLIAKVEAKLGAEHATPDGFSDQLYTVRPKSPFSLDNLMAQKPGATSFVGDIHRGNFEHEGPVAIPDVEFEVTHIVVARALSATTPPDPVTTYLVFGTEGDLYAVNRITSQANMQRVLVISASSSAKDLAVTPIHAVAVEFPNLDPLALNGAHKGRVRGSQASTDVDITVVRTLSCLIGPDFYSKKC